MLNKVLIVCISMGLGAVLYCTLLGLFIIIQAVKHNDSLQDFLIGVGTMGLITFIGCVLFSIF